MASETSAVFVAVRVRPLQAREDPLSCSLVVHDDTTISAVDVTPLLSSSSVTAHGRDGVGSSSSYMASPSNSNTGNSYGANYNDTNSLSNSGVFLGLEGVGGDGAMGGMGMGGSSAPTRHTFSVDQIFWSVPSSVLPIPMTTDAISDTSLSNHASYASGNPAHGHVGGGEGGAAAAAAGREGHKGARAGVPKTSPTTTSPSTVSFSSPTTARRLCAVSGVSAQHYSRNLPCFAPAPPYDSQASVYASLGPRLYEAAMQGFNTCLFAYGQTGSGKTHSMIGPPDTRLLLRMCSRASPRRARRAESVGTRVLPTSMRDASDDSNMNTSSSSHNTGDAGRVHAHDASQGVSLEGDADTATLQTTKMDATAAAAAGDTSECAGVGGEDVECVALAAGAVPAMARSDASDAEVCEEDEEGLGVMPRLCRDLFDGMHREREADASVSHNVEVSFFEIYCEKVRDLLAGVVVGGSTHGSSSAGTGAAALPSSSLAPSNGGGGGWTGEGHSSGAAGHVHHSHYLGAAAATGLRVRQHPTRGSYVEGLRHLQVKNTADVMRYLMSGLRDRATAETRMNEHSSRSHAIMQLRLVRVTVVSEENGVVTKTRECKMSMVDLAGSERVSQSGATGERFEETRNINLSLSTLGRVIQQLSEKQAGKHVVPAYRDSVLTWLLADSLGGNSKTTMLATVAPSAYCYSQTVNTLRFAGVTKKIINVATVHEDRHFQQLIAELRQQIVRLTLKLESGKMSVKQEAQLETARAEKAQLRQQNDALLARLAHVADDSVLHALRMRVSELEEENGTLRGELATLQQRLLSTTHSLRTELADREEELQHARDQLRTTQGQVHHWMRCARDALQASVHGTTTTTTTTHAAHDGHISIGRSNKNSLVDRSYDGHSFDGGSRHRRGCHAGHSRRRVEVTQESGAWVADDEVTNGRDGGATSVASSHTGTLQSSGTRSRARNRPTQHNTTPSRHAGARRGGRDSALGHASLHEGGGDVAVSSVANRHDSASIAEVEAREGSGHLLQASELCSEFAHSVDHAGPWSHQTATPLFDRALLSQQTRVIQRLREKVQQLGLTLTRLRRREREACERARAMESQLGEGASERTRWQSKCSELERQLRATAELLLAHTCEEADAAAVTRTASAPDAHVDPSADTDAAVAPTAAAQEEETEPKKKATEEAEEERAKTAHLLAQLRRAREDYMAEKQVSIDLLLRASSVEEELATLKDALRVRVADSAEMEQVLLEETETSERYYTRMRYYRSLVALHQQWLSMCPPQGAGARNGAALAQRHRHSTMSVILDESSHTANANAASSSLSSLSHGRHVSRAATQQIEGSACGGAADWQLEQCAYTEGQHRMQVEQTFLSERVEVLLRLVQSQRATMMRIRRAQQNTARRRASQELRRSDQSEDVSERVPSSPSLRADTPASGEQHGLVELRHELQTMRQSRDEAERALESLIARYAALQSAHDDVGDGDDADADAGGNGGDDEGVSMHEMRAMLERYRAEAAVLRTRRAEDESATQRREQRLAALTEAHDELREMYDHAARSYELQLQERQAMNRTLQSALEEETHLADVTRTALQCARAELTAQRDLAVTREEEMTELRQSQNYLRRRHLEIQSQLDELVVQCGETAAGLRALRQQDEESKTYHVYEPGDIHNSEAWLERAREQKLALQQQKREARRLHVELSQHARAQAERLRDVERQLSVVFSRSGFARSTVESPGTHSILSHDDAAGPLGGGAMTMTDTSVATTADDDRGANADERIGGGDDGMPMSEFDDNSLDLTVQYENMLPQTDFTMTDDLNITPYPEARTPASLVE